MNPSHFFPSPIEVASFHLESKAGKYGIAEPVVLTEQFKISFLNNRWLYEVPETGNPSSVLYLPGSERLAGCRRALPFSKT